MTINNMCLSPPTPASVNYHIPIPFKDSLQGLTDKASVGRHRSPREATSCLEPRGRVK